MHEDKMANIFFLSDIENSRIFYHDPYNENDTSPFNAYCTLDIEGEALKYVFEEFNKIRMKVKKGDLFFVYDKNLYEYKLNEEKEDCLDTVEGSCFFVDSKNNELTLIPCSHDADFATLPNSFDLSINNEFYPTFWDGVLKSGLQNISIPLSLKGCQFIKDGKEVPFPIVNQNNEFAFTDEKNNKFVFIDEFIFTDVRKNGRDYRLISRNNYYKQSNEDRMIHIIETSSNYIFSFDEQGRLVVE